LVGGVCALVDGIRLRACAALAGGVCALVNKPIAAARLCSFGPGPRALQRPPSAVHAAP